MCDTFSHFSFIHRLVKTQARAQYDPILGRAILRNPRDLGRYLKVGGKPWRARSASL